MYQSLSDMSTTQTITEIKVKYILLDENNQEQHNYVQGWTFKVPDIQVKDLIETFWEKFESKNEKRFKDASIHPVYSSWNILFINRLSDINRRFSLNLKEDEENICEIINRQTLHYGLQSAYTAELEIKIPRSDKSSFYALLDSVQNVVCYQIGIMNVEGNLVEETQVRTLQFDGQVFAETPESFNYLLADHIRGVMLSSVVGNTPIDQVLKRRMTARNGWKSYYGPYRFEFGNTFYKKNRWVTQKCDSKTTKFIIGIPYTYQDIYRRVFARNSAVDVTPSRKRKVDQIDQDVVQPEPKRMRLNDDNDYGTLPVLPMLVFENVFKFMDIRTLGKMMFASKYSKEIASAELKHISLETGCTTCRFSRECGYDMLTCIVVPRKDSNRDGRHKILLTALEKYKDERICLVLRDQVSERQIVREDWDLIVKSHSNVVDMISVSVTNIPNNSKTSQANVFKICQQQVDFLAEKRAYMRHNDQIDQQWRRRIETMRAFDTTGFKKLNRTYHSVILDSYSANPRDFSEFIPFVKGELWTRFGKLL